MKKIINKADGSYIIGTGLDQINDAIRYQINNSDHAVIDSGVVQCPDMWAAMDSNKVEPSDVNLTGREITYNYSTALIYGFNLLTLNLADWDLINEYPSH